MPSCMAPKKWTDEVHLKAIMSLFARSTLFAKLSGKNYNISVYAHINSIVHAVSYAGLDDVVRGPSPGSAVPLPP